MIKELFKDDAVMFYVTIAFIAIFIVMLFATLFISIKTKAENDKLKREIKKFLHMIKYEYALIYDNNNVSTKHIEYICKKMKNYRFFQVMDGALQQLIGKNKTIAEENKKLHDKIVESVVGEFNAINQTTINTLCSYVTYVDIMEPLTTLTDPTEIHNQLITTAGELKTMANI